MKRNRKIEKWERKWKSFCFRRKESYYQAKEECLWRKERFRKKRRTTMTKLSFKYDENTKCWVHSDVVSRVSPGWRADISRTPPAKQQRRVITKFSLNVLFFEMLFLFCSIELVHVGVCCRMHTRTSCRPSWSQTQSSERWRASDSNYLDLSLPAHIFSRCG